MNRETEGANGMGEGTCNPLKTEPQRHAGHGWYGEKLENQPTDGKWNAGIVRFTLRG
jgi:hypothetical protein